MDDYCLLLTFENGEKRVFDLKPYFDKPIFAGLKNIASFKTARVVSGSVEWQMGSTGRQGWRGGVGWAGERMKDEFCFACSEDFPGKLSAC